MTMLLAGEVTNVDTSWTVKEQLTPEAKKFEKRKTNLFFKKGREKVTAKPEKILETAKTSCNRKSKKLKEGENTTKFGKQRKVNGFVQEMPSVRSQEERH